MPSNGRYWWDPHLLPFHENDQRFRMKDVCLEIALKEVRCSETQVRDRREEKSGVSGDGKD